MDPPSLSSRLNATDGGGKIPKALPLPMNSSPVALITGAGSIRDVIAFPKTQKGVCPLTEAPSPVEPGQLLELGLRLDVKDKNK